MPFNEGENVGPYRVMGKLGRGGMATVYKAYHASLDRFVALKVLHPAFLEDPNFLARFQREARLVAKLEHPNIVPIYDFAEHEKQPYLVLKYVEGETLKAHLSRGRLNVDQIWDVVNAVGAGLGYAHKQGILHRDIKPSNVIVAKDGQTYLADFGLARIAQSGESTLSSDMIMGTPQYISPEQAMGTKELDEGTDIYSFAVMLYEMVVGQVPFSSDTPFSIIHDHIYSPLPLPRTINPSVPDEVERVLLKALAKERKDRHQDIPALVKAFKQAWKDSDADMADVTMTSPIRKPEPGAPIPIPVALSTSPTAATIAQAEAEEIPSPEKTEIPDKPKKKKRKIWVFLAAGLLLIFACIFILSTLGQDNLASSLEDEPGISEPASPLLDEPPQDQSPRFNGEDQNPEIAAARDLVAENPDDPWAHLELALVILDNSRGQNPLAYEHLREAGELAEDDLFFFEEAGFNLMEREVWIGGAAMFMHAMELAQIEGLDTPELNDLFHENIYKAAIQPEMPKYINFEEIGHVDEAMMLVVEARHNFYHGDPKHSNNILQEVKRMAPDFPEASLLTGEIQARNRDINKARRTLEALLENPDTPEWIRFEVEEALIKLP